MPIPDLDRVLFNGDEKVFVINPQKTQPALRNVAKAIEVADCVMLWATREAHLPKYKDRIEALLPETLLWVCYPKLGRLETDLGRDKLWMWMKAHGFEGVRLVSVDDTWAAASFRKVAERRGCGDSTQPAMQTPALRSANR
jgi:hypothetical protein